MNKISWILLFITIGLVIYGLCTANDVQKAKQIDSLQSEIALMEERMAQNSLDYDRCSEIQESAHADNIVLEQAVETKKTELGVAVGLIKE
jgi:hypothetical protein